MANNKINRMDILILLMVFGLIYFVNLKPTERTVFISQPRRWFFPGQRRGRGPRGPPGPPGPPGPLPPPPPPPPPTPVIPATPVAPIIETYLPGMMF